MLDILLSALVATSNPQNLEKVKEPTDVTYIVQPTDPTELRISMSSDCTTKCSESRDKYCQKCSENKN